MARGIESTRLTEVTEIEEIFVTSDDDRRQAAAMRQRLLGTKPRPVQADTRSLRERLFAVQQEG